jgi:large subunit ribosomal protein L24
MKIKTGDKVKVLAGKDKGKTGKVLQIFETEKRVVVEGLNLMIKHQKPKKQGEKGQRIQFPSPINSSNVALICPKCGKDTRIGSKTIKSEDKNKKNVKNRICKKCNEVI